MDDAFAEMHHLVSRGYQQNFSNPEKRVTVIDPRSGKVIDPGRPIKSNFVRPGYNTRVTLAGAADSRLEREFARLERPVADQIRRITPENYGPRQLEAVVVLFALHLVRSEAFRNSHRQIIEQIRHEWIPELAVDPRIHDRYSAEFAVTPTGEDITLFADQLVQEHVRSNRLHVDSMVRQYNQLADRLSRFEIQVITSRSLDVGFALGDIPVVHANTTTGRYGFRDGLALGDADLIVGPVTRWTAVALSIRPMPPIQLTVKKQFQALNAVFVRAALREIACHPEDARELRRVCEHVDQLPPSRLASGPRRSRQ